MSLSSSAANLTEPEPEDRHRPIRRFYRSRSSGNLVDREEDTREIVDVKRCLIQEDEEDDNTVSFETDFQQRLVMANRMNGFERHT